MVAKLPHASDENDEGLQRTPEFESSMVMTAVWQVHSNSTINSIADDDDEGLQRTPEFESSMVMTAVWQVHSNSTINSYHASKFKTLMRLKLQRLLLLLLRRRERPRHKRTSVEWQKRQAETATGNKGNKTLDV